MSRLDDRCGGGGRSSKQRAVAASEAKPNRLFEGYDRWANDRERHSSTNASLRTRQYCVGMLICMDVDHPTFSQAIIRRVRSSECRLKLICIPADMGSYSFNGDTVPSQLHGVNVILCNHTKTHQNRCKSFITDMRGRKIVVQKSDEPVHVQLP